MSADSDVGSDTLAPVSSASRERPVLVTGANGFIGSWVVKNLTTRGFRHIRCLTRSPDGCLGLTSSLAGSGVHLEVVHGNLLSRETCTAAVNGTGLVYHLAAGVEKSFPGCFLNSAVATRNLLEAVVQTQTVRRFVSVSSLAVYSNENVRRGGVIDESCEIDTRLAERFDAYAYGKAKQDEVVRDYGERCGVPYVILRPGVTFGPGKDRIPGRVGIDTFGVFLHLGLGNRLPLTYVENCADAIVLGGLVAGIEGEEFNIIDDDLPRSREFLKKYRRDVRSMRAIPVPYHVFYAFCYWWERYSEWSAGQLPPAFNRRLCESYYKAHTYPNDKARSRLGWRPRVGMAEAMDRYCAYAGSRGVRA